MLKRNVTLIILLLLGLTLMLGGDGARLAKARFLSHSLYYPLLSSLQLIRNVRQARMQNRTLHEQNALLLQRNTDLENRLLRFEEMEIAYLPPQRDIVVADVIGFSGAFRQRQLIINRGAADGVMVNLPVLNSDGVVGKIIATAPRHSTVLPVGHPQFRMGVADKRTHVQGMLEARNGKTLMSMIPIDAEVALGDSVITSNLSTIFPKGVPVGVVRKLERHPLYPYLQAELKPVVSIGSLEQVTVLLRYTEDRDSLQVSEL